MYKDCENMWLYGCQTGSTLPPKAQCHGARGVHAAVDDAEVKAAFDAAWVVGADAEDEEKD